MVRRRLVSEAESRRDLWLPMAEEFVRGGPDAVAAFLDVEIQRLERRTTNLLEQVEGGLNLVISGFRVQTVAIEGFKGFTNRKEIDLRGRHVFLLGRNGNGKSSILEAIRWGLFGSTRRPDEVITNRGYVGRCRVELTLVRDGKLWNLRRTLNRGTTGGSDRVLTDEHGNEHNVSEIMPQLDSVDSGEGMHIIFSAQSAPLRRPSRNLSAFERTVLHHLGLTHPRGLQAVLETFSDTSQRPAEDRLEVNLNIARANVDDQINDLERHRGRILDAQPWDGDRSPTVAESQGKARSLISEIMGSDPDSSLGGATLGCIDRPC